ncbi:hypothetical protein ODJ79_37285 [Actinoplanes sp. KI2]|uniref:hypothetical protein n=1 Tax=Actinoplanes sp. KI2 TaxID=2983315 RepID=UPI0021D584E8|nr:hypothetical protein [Actinoplanes sp. KI2]MCU7729403.1 hypothetical protein [Actinoplanes sp. KI2]
MPICAVDVAATDLDHKECLDAVDGLRDNSKWITSLDGAIRTGEAWKRFRETGRHRDRRDAGRQLLRRSVRVPVQHLVPVAQGRSEAQSKITQVTAEPFLGHFGIGGLPHGDQLLGMFLR